MKMNMAKMEMAASKPKDAMKKKIKEKIVMKLKGIKLSAKGKC